MGAIEHSWRAEGQTGTHSVCSHCDRLGGPGSGQNALPIGSRCCSCGGKKITISRAERVLFSIIITNVERETGSNKKWKSRLWFLERAALLGQALGTVKVREERRFTDQTLLLAGGFTGSVGGGSDHLERAQWRPARCVGTKVLRGGRKRERAERNAAVDTAERTCS